MRRIIPLFIAAGLLAPGSANARPSGPCAISILRAPPDVRATVESWVERETSCRVALEVRIVPTDGGLYLFARDERERIYERIVPDAQSAGVLVASWMADDTMTGEPPVEMTGEPPAESAPVPSISDSAAVDEVFRAVERGPSHWLMVEGMLGGAVNGGSLSGARVDVDVVRTTNWNLGVSASIASGGLAMTVIDPQAVELGAVEHTTDIKALIYAARQIDLGAWHVRPSFGLGALISSVHVVDAGYPAIVMDQTINVASVMGELSFVVARDLNPSWAIHGGLALDLTQQHFELSPASDSYGFAYANRSLDIVLLFGVGRRL